MSQEAVARVVAEDEPEEPEQNPFVDLEDFGITEDADVSAEAIAEILRERPDVIEGLKRNFYWGIRRAIRGDYDRRHARHPMDSRAACTDYGECIIRPFRTTEDAPPPWGPEHEGFVSEREFLVGEDHKSRYITEFAFRIGDRREDGEDIPEFRRGREVPVDLSLIFSADDATASKYWNRLNQTYTSPDDFTFHGAFVYAEHGKRRILLKEADIEYSGDRNPIEYSLDEIKTLLESSDPIPEIRCDEAVSVIRQLAEEEGFEEREVEDFVQAVRDFATFHKREPTTGEILSEIGRCLTIPPIFRDFCRDKYNLPVNDDFYEVSGGGGMLSPPIFYHGVNTYRDRIVIDWTARQFREFDGEPYPFVYKVGDPRISKFWEELCMIKMKREREDEAEEDNKTDP